ncbi:uncharacterized protein [Symphalangus syndactylus]|uniref:uncharacterized protein n=1 Tax=Symphalangus syndactylus TaxID=9590 RepID=UPI003005D7AF
MVHPPLQSEQDLPQKQNRIPLTGTMSRDSDSSAQGPGRTKAADRSQDLHGNASETMRCHLHGAALAKRLQPCQPLASQAQKPPERCFEDKPRRPAMLMRVFGNRFSKFCLWFVKKKKIRSVIKDFNK